MSPRPDSDVRLWDTREFERRTRGWSLAAAGAYAHLRNELWDQDEPGIVPAEDRSLALLAKATPGEWAEVRAQVATAFDTTSRPGWWIHDDTVERANAQRVAFERRSLAGTVAVRKRWNRSETPPQQPRQGQRVTTNGRRGAYQSNTVLVSVESTEEPSGGTEVGSGVGVIASSVPTPQSPLPLFGVESSGGQHPRARAKVSEADEDRAQFETWWELWPRKDAKQRAWRAWRKTVRGRTSIGLAVIRTTLEKKREWETRPSDRWPYPATFLNDHEWEEIARRQGGPVNA